MANNHLWNDVIVPFLTNMLAWVFGVAITFAGQAQIDKKHDLEGISTALNLVVEELATNIDDLQYAHLDMKDISYSAEYLNSNVDNLRSCPADSIDIHWSRIHTESYLTLSTDAYQMLESTYLFSDLLDRNLALSIVRAYDICGSLERSFNDFEERRIVAIEKLEDFFMAQADSGKGSADIRTIISSRQSRQTLQRVSTQTGEWIDGAVLDIRGIMSEINDYLTSK